MVIHRWDNGVRITVKLDFLRTILNMSSRMRRLNNVTPTSDSAESVASTTPTTPTARAKRSVRNKKSEMNETATTATTIDIKSEKIDDDEEAVKESIEDEDKSDAAKIGEPVAAKKEIVLAGIAATRKRRITAVKEEPIVGAANVAVAAASSDTSSPSTTDDGKTSPTKVKRSRRSAIEILTGNKPVDTPRIGKRRNSTGKIEKPARKLSSRIKKLTQMRKVNLKRTLLKKPDNKLTTTINRPPTKQAATKKGKIEKNSDSASDSELLKMTRRRSDSVSKCSDMTDTSSFQETKDADEMPLGAVVAADAVKGVEIKQESIEKDEEMATKTDGNEVNAPATRSSSDIGAGADTDNSQPADECKRPQYRLRRKPVVHPLPQKVMNTRSRSDTPQKIEPHTEAATSLQTTTTLHIETLADESKPAQVAEETADIEHTSNSSSGGPANAVANKLDGENAESLSPLLVSEGLSEISVKQFYGRPDFLENNLGIEKDPKLGDIVQVQEKIKSETSDDCRSDNGEKSQPGQIDIVDSEKTADAHTTEKVEMAKSEVENDAATAARLGVSRFPQKNEETDSEEYEESGEEEGDEAEEEEEEDEIEQVEQVKTSSAADADDSNCFVKPIEQLRKNSTSLLNENLLLNGEIEVRPKEKNVATKIADADVVSEVVLYTITTNGMRVNPEKLEKIIENQKQKEKDEQMAAANDDRCAVQANGDSIDSTEEKPIILDGTTITKIEEPIEIEDNEPPPPPPLPPSSPASATVAIQDEEQMEVDAAVESKENVDKTNQMAIDTAPLTTSNKGSSRSSSIDDETIEDLKQKESHLKTLGLLTHQAAVEATIEKQKRREQLKASIASSSTAGGKGKKNSSEYTGTLKTVIKLHRSGGGSSSSEGKKKGNLPLKMTLHKGRAKNGGNGNNSNDRCDPHSAANSEEDTYYTIQNQDIDGIGECDLNTKNHFFPNTNRN